MKTSATTTFFRALYLVLFFLGLVLLADAYRQEAGQTELLHAESLLAVAAENMSQAAQPQQIFRKWIDLGFSTGSMAFTATSAAEIITSLQKTIPASLTVFAFDPQHRLVFPPHLKPALKHDKELWWSFIHKYLQELPFSPDETGAFGQAMRVLRRQFGPGITLEHLARSSREFLTYANPAGEETLFAIRYQEKTGTGTEKAIGFSGMNIEMSMKAFSPELQAAEILAVKPDNLPFAEVTCSGKAALPGRNQGAFPISLNQADRLAERQVIALPEGFFYREPLSLLPSHSLIVGIPHSEKSRLLKKLCPILIWAGFPVLILLFGIHVLRRRMSQRSEQGWPLSVLIPTAFAVSAALPLLSLLGIGFNRLEGTELATKNLWREHSTFLLGDIDRRFHNYLEGLQEDFTRLANVLSRRFRKGEKISLPYRFSYATGILYVTKSGKTFSYKPDRRAVKQENPKVVQLLKDVFQDLLQQVLASRGQADPKRGPEKLKLSLQDVIGEDSNFLTVFKSLEKIVIFGLDQTNNISFFRLLTEPNGKITGLILFMSRVDSEANPFFLKEDRHFARSTIPVKLLVWGDDINLHSRYACADPRFFAAFDRTRATGAGEELSVKVIGFDQDFLTWTHKFRHFTSFRLAGGIDSGFIIAERQQVKRSIRLWTALGIIITLFLAWGLWQRLVSPLGNLTIGIREITGGNFRIRIADQRGDEFGVLATAFNEMAEGLQQRERMRRFVSRAAWQDSAEAASPETTQGKREEVAVLFADIRSFTTLSESHPPQQVTAMLNRYFSLMDEVIAGHEGEIWKLIGDAIFAVFRCQATGEHPGIRAAKAGLAMRQALHAFNSERRRAGVFDIDNGIGIHFGSALIGRVGSASGRLDFTVIGSPVTLATENETLSKFGLTSRVMVSTDLAAVLEPVLIVTRRSIEGKDLLEVDAPPS
jgi:class 3 adenylate cyclase